MVSKLHQKQVSKRLTASTVAAISVVALCSLAPMMAQGQPEKADEDHALTREDIITERRDDMHAKANLQREQAKERAAAIRHEAVERRKMQQLKAAARREETNKQKEQAMAFKVRLLDMLIDDGVIATDVDLVDVTYLKGDVVANTINVSVQFGEKYTDLWTEYDRVISDQSYLKITPGTYEIKEITEDGSSHHFVMQSN